MGQYISPDPIGLLGGLHPMAYVHNPNGWVDPWGLDPIGTSGYSVYGLYEAGATKPYYIGITKQNILTRMGQHMDSGRYGNTTTHKILKNNITIEKARGYEQYYIEKHQTKTGTIGESISSTNRGNKINSFDRGRSDPRGVAFNQEYE